MPRPGRGCRKIRPIKKGRKELVEREHAGIRLLEAERGGRTEEDPEKEAAGGESGTTGFVVRWWRRPDKAEGIVEWDGGHTKV
jgi:hypothetical protein